MCILLRRETLVIIIYLIPDKGIQFFMEGDGRGRSGHAAVIDLRYYGRRFTVVPLNMTAA